MSKVVVEAPTDASVTHLTEAFLNDALARGLSPRTVMIYQDRLRRVLPPFCSQQGITEVQQFDRAAFSLLSRELQEVERPNGRKLSRASVSSYLNTVNIWLNWCQEEMGQTAPARARLPKLERKLLNVLTREDVAKMVAAAEVPRDAVIVRVLADTGIRASELLGLRPSDLKRVGRQTFIQVRGKGSKERMVAVNNKTFQALQDFARGQKLDPEEPIFRTLRRKASGQKEPMSLDALQGMLRILALRAGIKKRVYTHLFRHSYATYMLNQNVNPVQLARMLGHSSLRMVDQVYSHLTPGDSYEAMAKAFADQ